MTVSVIIPNWNRRYLLERLLASLREQILPAGIQMEVLVVDNGSTDSSVQVARQSGVNVLCLARNEGVSRALNRGIQASAGEYVVLLNNDVELTPNWLSELLSTMSDPQVWFATGKMLQHDNRGQVDGAGDAVCRGGTSWRLGHGKADGAAFTESRSTYFPSATATLIRRAFFDRVGLLDESLFAYLEDVDLGFRAAIEDLPGRYVPEAVAYHRGSDTAGAWSPRMVEWLTCHQLLLLGKFYPGRLLLRFAWPILVAQLLWALLALSRGRAVGWARGFVRGVARWRGTRRGSQALRKQPQRLGAVLESTEAEILRVQRATGWDTYWKWYFRLAHGASGGTAWGTAGGQP